MAMNDTEASDDFDPLDPALVERIRAAMAPLARPAWKADVSAVLVAPGMEADPRGSRYRGRPWMPDREAWPERGGKPLAFVAQFEVAAMPDPARSLLGGRGLLQIFYDQGGDFPASGDTSELASVRVVDIDLPGALRAAPDPSARGGERPSRRVSGWLPSGDEYPHWEDFPEFCGFDALGDEADALEAAERGGGPLAPYARLEWGDKLGGWPAWTQGAEWPLDRDGDRMDYVMQFEANPDGIHFAGDGTGHVFVSPATGEMRFAWACG